MENRSYEALNKEHLAILRRVVCEERRLFFERNPHLKGAFRDNLVATCLCQGAAQHFVDGTTGVKDFDVYWFYREHPQANYPYRALKETYRNFPTFGTRKVDLMGRTIDSAIVERHIDNLPECIREYLRKSRTQTTGYLIRKAVVGLHPESIFGKVIWPE